MVVEAEIEAAAAVEAEVLEVLAAVAIVLHKL